jgi:holo-[acyl-carrier protein] synthase
MILRCGVDLVEIERFQMQPRLRERFLARIFTPAEIELCADKDQTFAGRFAVKEAVAKALGSGIGEISWQEIEVLADDQRAPLLVLHGKAAERAQALGLTQWSVSISHQSTLAVGMAVALGEDPAA